MTTLFGNSAVPTEVQPPAAAAPKKHGWLPVLTILFLISYGLMTMLIVEQGATIESQRALIRELFRDSVELSAARTKAQQERAQALAARSQSTMNQSPMNPSIVNPSTQANQTPSSQAGSSQAGPQNHARNQSAKPKPLFEMPSRPASDLVDARRTLKTI